MKQRETDIKKSVIIVYGPRHSGKSALIKIICKLFGSSVSRHEWICEENDISLKKSQSSKLTENQTLREASLNPTAVSLKENEIRQLNTIYHLNPGVTIFFLFSYY